MISIYTSAVLTTAVVAGLTLYAVETSKAPSPVAMDAEAMHQAHLYGMARGEAMITSDPATNVTYELSTGPFYDNGRAHSYLVLEPESVGGVPGVNRYIVTSLSSTGMSARTKHDRVKHVFSKDESTTIGTMGSDGHLEGGEELPPITVSIPEGAVVAITKIKG